MMHQAKPKVVVAMSGGVDSSVAACLLHEKGYDVVGLFMRTGVTHDESTTRQDRHRGCCSATDAADARFVAGSLGIPFYALNFEQEFDGIIQYFADEYASGRTPNPCVVCNHKLKFGRLLEYADAVGAQYVATGHYARVETVGGRPRLRAAIDAHKDQSYVLFGLNRDILDRILFPVGHLDKETVRHEARRFGLRLSDKPDSVEICFVPDGDFTKIVQSRRPDAFREGPVVDHDGREIGRHGGVGRYTIGQRRGLGIAAGEPIYVTEINLDSNRLVMGSRESLLQKGLRAGRVNWLDDPGSREIRAWVKIRYLHKPAPATVTPLDGGNVKVVFDGPQPAITPGQAAVFYGADGYVIGGGWIECAFDPHSEAIRSTACSAP